MRDRIERDAGSPFPPEPAAGYAFLGTAADKELSGAASVLAWNSRADAAARTRPKPGYSVAIALRYIPDIQRDYHSISQAQQARGVELGKNEHFFARLKNSVNILLPLILTSLNRIDTISNAMELRGFGKDKKRTWYMKRPFEKRDFVAIGVGMVLLVVSMTVTIRWGRFYNPFV